MILTNENYFTLENNMKYMSVSQFKMFEDCEARALAELRGDYVRETSVALMVGSYVDAHFEQTLDIFKAQNPDIFKRDGTLKSDYEHADYIIQRIERDEMFMKYMSGQKQVIMTGEIAEMPVKIKIDSYHPGKCIVDLKVMRDFEEIYVPEKGRLNFIEAWKYDYQAAIYQEIERQNSGTKLPFFIAAATKEKPEPDIDLFQIPQAQLDACLQIFIANAPRYTMLKQGIGEPLRCEKCAWCRQTKVLTEIKIIGDVENGI